MTDISQDIQLLSFQIILHAGNARSYAMEAIHEAKEYHFKEAREKIELADEEFTKAHHEQTKLLQEESKGSKHEVTVILVHAQDHLDRKSTRLNSSHVAISYAVFCLKIKNTKT